jgi:hypothetical protein
VELGTDAGDRGALLDTGLAMGGVMTDEDGWWWYAGAAFEDGSTNSGFGNDHSLFTPGEKEVRDLSCPEMRVEPANI